ncbi:MAG: histidine kinase [Acidobacteriota bacterium]
MPATAGARGTRHLFWLYGLSWLPFLIAYGVALGLSLDVDFELAALGALANGLPPALLGWPALRASRMLSRRRPPPAVAFARHVVAGSLYVLASGVGTWLVFKLVHRLQSGAWHWALGDTRPLFWQMLICSLLYLVLAGFGRTWALADRLREEAQRSARARELAARSELSALRSRLDPHFLFNTLHSLLALVRSDPTAAEEALERFGDLLRYVLATRSPEAEEVRLAEEKDFLGDYLELERLRLGDRLRVDEHFETAALGCRLPAFTLQPLVENAVRYAVAARSEGGRIEIRADLADSCLRLEVRDDGPGARPEAVADGGLGIALVRDRLQALHGDAAGLEVETEPGAGFLVRIWLPKVGDEEVAGP